MDNSQEKIDVICKRCGARMILKGKPNGEQAYLCTNLDCKHQPIKLEFREDIWDIYLIREIHKICINRRTPLLTMNQLAKLFNKNYGTTTNWIKASKKWVHDHTPKPAPNLKQLKEYIKKMHPDTCVDILNLCLLNGKESAIETLKRLDKIKCDKKHQGRPKSCSQIQAAEKQPSKQGLTQITKEHAIELGIYDLSDVDWLDDNDVADFGWYCKEDKESYELEQSRIRMENAIAEYNNKVENIDDFKIRAFELDYPIEDVKDAILWFGIIIGCSFGELIGAKFGDRIENNRFIHLTRYVKFPTALKRPYPKSKTIGFDMFDILSQDNKIKIIENNFDNIYLVDDRATRMLDYLQEHISRSKQTNPSYDYSFDDFICLNESGKIYYLNELQVRLDSLCKKLGTENIQFQDFANYGKLRKLSDKP